VTLIFPIDLARAYIDAACAVPGHGFDESGMSAFQPDAYRGLKISRSHRKPPSAEMMRRTIGFRPALVVPKASVASVQLGLSEGD
jgi:hypothetical protein